MAEVTFRVLGYKDGWRGFGAHLWDLLRGKPVRTMRDVVATVKLEADGRLRVDAVTVTLPAKRKDVSKTPIIEV